MATVLRDAAAAEVEEYLLANQAKSLLRFLTCGSVDDGKSTLIGRLLYDSKMLFEDQLAALEAESRKVGTQAEGLDFALLVDGLAAEREQGITIDVAYRFFATDKRKFIVADAPGHEQYTRNMVTGASSADLAVILVDARKGVLPQTRRHSVLADLLGIRELVVAVNKMDLVGYDRARFDEIAADYRAFAAEAGIERFTFIPVSGLAGDNVTRRSAAMPWHDGPTLLEYLEQVPVGAATGERDGFVMPVQWVNRPNQSFRGYAGTIAGGRIRPGDPVVILPSGRRTSVERIVTFDGELDSAMAGQSVTLTLADEVDCSRGDVIAAVEAPPATADRFEAALVWMASEPLVPGRAYWLKIGTQTVSASVAAVHGTRDRVTLEPGEGRALELNDIGRCEVLLDRAVTAAPYAESRRLGRFILIDRASNATVAAGMIGTLLDGADRADVADPGRIIWLTGASALSRSDFARRAQQRLQARGRPTFILDAAALRDGLSSDLGGGPTDEAENRRRVREVAKLMSRAGVTVLVALDVPEGEEKPGTELDVASASYEGDWVI
ncbi:sulfate adenylyltransferase subunit CysN [Sphingosinicella sp. CPCC 101087]|uniref:sulfate adenylyltransferase subunit CysN n=1 Tax=Sphingosinicella sp. CPCC 101087 TaxID=2497754 RepID=UPI00101BB4B8|nr:sulfate adenylyltransferase subunit CysN [Sphingosinicella sp. CPCC 101087]